LQDILVRYGMEIDGKEKSSDEVAAGNLDKSTLEENGKLMKDVMIEIFGTIQRCANCCPYPTDASPVEPIEEETVLPFERSILAESAKSFALSSQNKLKFVNWRKDTVEKLLDESSVGDKKSTSGFTGKAVQRYRDYYGAGSSAVVPNGSLPASVAEASKALDGLTGCYLAVDQMLQLRFQVKGVAHFEGLGHLVAGGLSGSNSTSDSGNNSGTGSKEVIEDGLLTPLAAFEVCIEMILILLLRK
jgi:hypothetical protein